MKVSGLVTLAGLLAAFPAHAQQAFMLGNGLRPNPAGPGQTISVNVQMAMPLRPATADTDLTKTLADASATLYGIVGHECDILASALRGSCRMVGVNTGGNVNTRTGQPPFLNANVNATFEITPPVPDPAK